MMADTDTTIDTTQKVTSPLATTSVKNVLPQAKPSLKKGGRQKKSRKKKWPRLNPSSQTKI